MDVVLVPDVLADNGPQTKAATTALTLHVVPADPLGVVAVDEDEALEEDDGLVGLHLVQQGSGHLPGVERGSSRGGGVELVVLLVPVLEGVDLQAAEKGVGKSRPAVLEKTLDGLERGCGGLLGAAVNGGVVGGRHCVD